MTSGSCRIAARSAVEKSSVSTRTSRWLIIAELVEVQHLDRVLDRDDVHFAVVVDVVDHAGERGRLAGPGRAGDQHQPARLERERREHRRQAEVLERDRADATPAGRPGRHEPRERKALTRNRPTPGERVARSRPRWCGGTPRPGPGAGPRRPCASVSAGGQVAGLQLAQPAVDAHARRGADLAVQVGPAALERARAGTARSTGRASEVTDWSSSPRGPHLYPVTRAATVIGSRAARRVSPGRPGRRPPGRRRPR